MQQPTFTKQEQMIIDYFCRVLKKDPNVDLDKTLSYGMSRSLRPW